MRKLMKQYNSPETLKKVLNLSRSQKCKLLCKMSR